MDKSEPGHVCVHPGCCGPSLGQVEAEVGAAPPPGSPQQPPTRGVALWVRLRNWLLWFLAFFGIYASSSVCVFCGTPGCPVGAGGAAVVGGIFTVLWQYGRRFWDGALRLWRRTVRGTPQIPQDHTDSSASRDDKAIVTTVKENK